MDQIMRRVNTPTLPDHGTFYISTTSSPHHSQSNGRAEAAVKTMKNVIKKAKGGDAWNAILEWRNTVTPGTDSSPVQRLMSRRTRSIKACHTSLYKPHVQHDVTEQVINRRPRAKKYYDCNAMSMPELVTGQPIRAKVHSKDHRSDRKSGVVKAKVAPRSYLVEVNGRSYRRKRVHIRDVLQNKTPVQTPEPVPDVITAENTQTEQLIAPAVQCEQNQVLTPKASPTRATSTPRCTKSGRISRPPAKYNDFV